MDCSDSVPLRSLLVTSLRSAERAANIARSIRSESSLFSLLVEEKVGESNTKLSGADFKTLADVLIQACITAELEEKFPALKGHILGEETSSFTNKNGETTVISIPPGDGDSARAATTDMLRPVLDGNVEAARALSAAIHCNIGAVAEEEELEDVSGEVDTRNLGVWLDPIDDTSQYMAGLEGNPVCGIHCAVVVLGVFNRNTGDVIAGVINQPFHHRLTSVESSAHPSVKWCGRALWGACLASSRFHSPQLAKLVTPLLSESQQLDRSSCLTVVGSRSEDKAVLERLATASSPSIRFLPCSGAAFKALCVATGQADAYVLTRASTYKWDTCGVHAVLRALGGHLVYADLAQEALTAAPGDVQWDQMEVRYNLRRKGRSASWAVQWCNSGGLVAFRSSEYAQQIIRAMTS